MTIKKTTKVFYYCDECDVEYDNKKQGLIICSNHKNRTGCENCMYKCRSEEKTLSGISGCDLSFCDDCIDGTYFDRLYPGTLCKNCIKKYKLEKYYGESGRKLEDKITEMLESGIPEEEINKKYFPEMADKM